VPRFLFPTFLVLLIFVLGCGGGESGEATSEAAPDVAGRLDAGLRVLTFDTAASGAVYRIYRGDYIRCELSSGEPFVLEVPDLGVSKAFPPGEDEKAYVKVPDAGRFPFTAGDVQGIIEAIDYQADAYREVSSADAAAFIENLEPVILDVRTEREFNGGHLPAARLVPVQVLKGRLAELMPLREQPLLIYCRTGNRSTVAAKMLVDAGFTNVVNMRRGIAEWQREGRPVVK